jgi:hypothetical protein
LVGAGKTYLNVVRLSFVSLAFLVLYPFSLSRSVMYGRSRQNGFYVIVSMEVSLFGPTKIVQCTHECGYWLIFLFAHSEFISLTENEYSGLEFWLDQPKICILVGIADLSSQFCPAQAKLKTPSKMENTEETRNIEQNGGTPT